MQPQQQLQVIVPNNASPGMMMQVQAPNGTLLQVQVPQNAKPGSSFLINIPAPVAMAVVVPQQVMIITTTQFPYPNEENMIGKYGGPQLSCCEDCESFLLMCCLPCCAIGKIAGAAHSQGNAPYNYGDCMLWSFAAYFCMPCVGGMGRLDLETRLTPPGQQPIKGDCFTACCCHHYCCHCCSVTQELRAIKNAHIAGILNSGGPNEAEMER